MTDITTQLLYWRKRFALQSIEVAGVLNGEWRADDVQVLPSLRMVKQDVQKPCIRRLQKVRLMLKFDGLRQGRVARAREEDLESRYDLILFAALRPNATQQISIVRR